MIVTRHVILDSELPHAELSETLRRAYARGDSNRLTDPLRAEGVDKLHFDLDDSGVFRITPVGLESGGGRSPRLAVEARVRVLPVPSGKARLSVAVGVTRGSWLGVLTGPAIFGAFGVVQLLRDPPSFGSCYFLLGAAALVAGVGFLRARALVERAWPGLEAIARRIATGSFYVPAA